MEFIRATTATPMAAAVTAAVIFSAGYYFSSLTSGGRRRKRSLSFSSDAMLNGAFPAESKVQQPVVGGVFYMKRMPPLDAMATQFSNLFQYDRMRSGVKKTSSGKLVLVDLGNNVDAKRDLIRTVHVENEQKLREMVNELCDKPMELEEDKLIWRVTCIMNDDPDGKSAFVVQLHHTIGDGIAMVSIMQKIFTKANGEEFHLEIAEKMRSSDRTSTSLLAKLGFVFKVFSSVFEILGLGVSKYDTDNAFFPHHNSKLAVTGKRHSMEFPAIKLEFIKEIKNRAKVTVNDVLMSITSGMMRRYMIVKNDSKNIQSLNQRTKMQMRALLPVAFPRPKKDLQNGAKALRNMWSFVSAPLTINEITPKERVTACAQITKALKKSPTAFIQLFMQNHIVSRLPQFLQRQIPFDIFSRHSIVFSNVPGPGDKISLCGEPILGMYIMFPNLIPQVILISYAGGIFFDLCADPADVDEKALARAFIEETLAVAEDYGITATEEDLLYKF